MEIEALLDLFDYTKRYDGYYMVLCPFHDDNHPSLMIFDDGWFRCLACDEHGHWSKLYHHIQQGPGRVTGGDQYRKTPSLPRDPNQLKMLAVDAHHTIINRPHLGTYWYKRGLRDEIIPCSLGYYAGWLTIPVYGPNGEFQRLVCRAGKQIQDTWGVRYHTSVGHPVPYAPDWERTGKARKVLITYGMIDAITLHHLGFAVMCSTAGKSTFDPKWLREFTQAAEIFWLPDLGEWPCALAQSREFGPRGRVIVLDYAVDDCKDPNDYLMAGKGELLKGLIERHVKETN